VKKFKLVEVYTGRHGAFYSVQFEGDELSLFDAFLNKFEASHPEVTESIISRITEMADQMGIRASRFKFEGPEAEAFNDTEDLRLYCLRFGSFAIIIGSGDTKPDGIETFQEKVELHREVKILEAVSKSLRYYGINVQNLKEFLYTDLDIDL